MCTPGRFQSIRHLIHSCKTWLHHYVMLSWLNSLVVRLPLVTPKLLLLSANFKFHIDFTLIMDRVIILWLFLCLCLCACLSMCLRVWVGVSVFGSVSAWVFPFLCVCDWLSLYHFVWLFVCLCLSLCLTTCVCLSLTVCVYLSKSLSRSGCNCVSVCVFVRETVCLCLPGQCQKIVCAFFNSNF